MSLLFVAPSVEQLSLSLLCTVLLHTNVTVPPIHADTASLGPESIRDVAEMNIGHWVTGAVGTGSKGQGWFNWRSRSSRT